MTSTQDPSRHQPDRGTARFVTLDGRRIHVIERGNGPAAPYLLLPGGLSHARWWDFVAPHLATARRVFAMDPLGHGDSDWLEPPTYGPHGQVREIGAVMSTCASGRWIIVGHSHGGLLAAVIAGTDPSRVRAIVLVDIPPVPTTPRLIRAGRRFRATGQPRFETRDAARASFRVFPDHHRAAPEVIEHLARQSVRQGPDGSYTTKFDWRFFRPQGSGRPFFDDFDQVLQRIACPSLCIRGEHSTILSAESLHRMAAIIPGAETAEIPDSTHHPHIENPLALARAISAFAERVAPEPDASPGPAEA